MAEFGPRHDVESERVLWAVRRQMFGRGGKTQVSRYERLERIGHGGMGVVYRAWDPALKRRVAIKVLHPRTGDQGRILDEARALARLSHPNIVGILDIGREGEDVFVVMEYVGGETLADVLAREPALSELMPLLGQVVEGLAAAHARSLVHHDIKPSNVLVSKAGVVRIADFGLARLLQQGEGPIGGTRGFAAPEQIEGRASDARADVYALTAIVFAAIHGHPPDARDEPARVRPSDRLRRFLDRGLAADPSQRHPTVHAWWAGLRAATRSRAPAVGGTLASLGLFGALLFGWAGAHAPRACIHTRAFPWTTDTRTAVESRFEATELPFSADTYQRVDARLTEYGRAWTTVRRDACSADDRIAIACSNAQQAGASELVGWLQTLNAEELERVMSAVKGLPEPGACAQSGAAADPELEAFDDAVARAQALVAAGRYPEARSLLESVALPSDTRRHAHRLGMHAFTLARALKLGADFEAAAREYEKAYLLQMLAGRDGTAAQAASQLAALLASELGEPVAARRWIRNASSALSRAVLAPEEIRGEVSIGIAYALFSLGDINGALEAHLLADTLLPQGNERRADLATMLAAIRYTQGDAAAALEAQERGLAIAREFHGDPHPRLVSLLTNIAILHEELGDPDRAQTVFEQALQMSEQTLGPTHRSTAVLRISIASDGLGRRDPEECIALFEHGLRDLEAAVGPLHASLNTALQGLAQAYLSAGRFDDAEAMILRAVEVANGATVLEPRVKAGIFTTHASVLRAKGRLDEARAQAETALELAEETLGVDHPNRAFVLTELSWIHLERGDPLAAREALAEAVRVTRGAYGAEHPETVRLQARLDAMAEP